jgi:hypothetical protein
LKNEQFWRGLIDHYGDPLKAYKATGLLAPIAGGDTAYGYNETDDILKVTVDGVPMNELYQEVEDTIRILNAQRNPLIERLTFPVAKPFEQVMPILGDEFEEADEWAQPRGIRMGKPWNMGYSLKYYDLGIRYTFRFLGRAPASQIRALNNSALEADGRLQFKEVLSRIFNNRTTSATLEDTGTVVSVYPFYNGDIDTLPVAPPTWKSYSFATSHTHYVSTQASSLVSGDLDDAYDHIHHHGYCEGATLILLVNRRESKIIRTFRVADGDAYDFIPKAGTTFLGTIVGNMPGNSSGLDVYPGFQGSYGPIQVIEEDYVPPGYFALFASGGYRAERNPVGIREHEHEGLRGLKLIPQFERYPLREAFYHHALGSGIRHPGAGYVGFVDSGSTYDIPTLSLQGPGGR